jgi:hypothetical protein
MSASNPSLTRLVLVLMMIIVVLLSLFWFLYQGYGALAEQAQQAEWRATRIVSLEMELGQGREALLSVQSTRTALEADLAEKILEHQTAERETIAEQQEKDALATRVAVLTEALETEAQPVNAPLTAVAQPLDGAILPLNEAVELLVVATDPAGLAAVSMSGFGEGATQTLEGQTTYIWRLFWLPPEVGVYTVVITAVNTAQITSQPISVTVQVVEEE